MIQIHLTFDEVSKTITDISIETEDSITHKNVESLKRKKKSSTTQVETSSSIELLDNKLQLNQQVLDILNAKIGDRLVVGYKNEGDKLIPFLGKAESFSGQEGNKLTKSLSISYRGDQNKTLAEHGSKFSYEEKDGLVKLIGENEVIKQAPIEETVEVQELVDLAGEEFEFDKVLFKI